MGTLICIVTLPLPPPPPLFNRCASPTAQQQQQTLTHIRVCCLMMLYERGLSSFVCTFTYCFTLKLGEQTNKLNFPVPHPHTLSHYFYCFIVFGGNRCSCSFPSHSVSRIIYYNMCYA